MRWTPFWRPAGSGGGETVLMRALEALQGELYLRLAERRPANEAGSRTEPVRIDRHRRTKVQASRRIIPDPQARNQAKLELLKLQGDQEMQTIAVQMQAIVARRSHRIRGPAARGRASST
jgi:hypothetical protein